jgi:hypothetical protein
MKTKNSVLRIRIPAIVSTQENSLRGGFVALSGNASRLGGGPNAHCGDNEVCSDNNYCYDNTSTRACAGNFSICISNTSYPSVTPTPTTLPDAENGVSFL